MPNDSHLQQTVVAELNREPGVTAAHIGVTASDGVVTLTGQVENFAAKHAAEAAATAWSAPGVTAVENNIVVV